MPHEGDVATSKRVHQRPALLFFFWFALPHQSKFNRRAVRSLANDDVHSLPILKRTGIKHLKVCSRTARPRGWIKQFPSDSTVDCLRSNPESVFHRLGYKSRVPDNLIGLANRSRHHWPDTAIESHHHISH